MVFFIRGEAYVLLVDRFGSFDMMYFVSKDWVNWKPGEPIVPLHLQKDLKSSYRLAAPGDYVAESGDLFMMIHGIWATNSNINLRLVAVGSPPISENTNTKSAVGLGN